MMIYFLEKENYWMSVFLAMVSIVSFLSGVMLMMEQKSFILEWNIMDSSGSELLFNFYMDWISVVFFSFVALISSSVLYYSGSYMSGSLEFRKFMVLVMMFVFSMFFLIFSLNLMSMMLGWDGLGVISYILVIFYKNEKSSSSGMITALSNRVGDAALLMGVACLMELGSWNYMFMDLLKNEKLMWLVGMAAITKSAQIPFSAWLPAAMAAPTPVSALVHSSTLVTAGVYILIRFYEIFSESMFLILLMYLSMLTTLMSSLVALFEIDFKKVVALSTLSQLGIMITTLCMGFVKLAFVHLLIHAIFKALLFMCSGKIIHNMAGYQDVRKMGGLFFNLPVTGMVINLSSYALCGVPFLSGFYSKDSIVEDVFMLDNFFMNYMMFMFIVGLSASYSFRLVYLSVVNQVNQNVSSVSSEKDWVMFKSKFGLMIMSLISGSLMIWLVSFTPSMVSLSLSLKWLALISVVLGYKLGVILCFSDYKSLFLMAKLKVVYKFMVLWNLSILSGSSFSRVGQTISFEINKMDLGWLEMFSGQGFQYLFLQGGSILQVWLTNSIKSFLLILVFSLMMF